MLRRPVSDKLVWRPRGDRQEGARGAREGLHLVCPGKEATGRVLRKVREPAALAKVLGESV